MNLASCEPAKLVVIYIENFAAEDPESLVAEKNENELISEITNWPRH